MSPASPPLLPGPAGLRTTAGVHLQADVSAASAATRLLSGGLWRPAGVPGRSRPGTRLVPPVVSTEDQLLIRSEPRDVQVEAPRETGWRMAK